MRVRPDGFRDSEGGALAHAVCFIPLIQTEFRMVSPLLPGFLAELWRPPGHGVLPMAGGICISEHCHHGGRFVVVGGLVATEAAL